MDFAGSGPVHIASGFGALAWSIMLGPRKDPLGESHHPKLPHFKPHNPFLVGIGTIFIWFGWLAFNGMFLNLEVHCLQEFLLSLWKHKFQS